MELDDLKNSWEAINKQVDNQQNLNPQIIDKMTRNKYNASLHKIIYPELIGTLVCFASAVYIGFNFGKLDTVFLQGAGILAILLLVALSIISLLSVRHFNMPADVSKPYAEILKAFAVQKIRFHKFQQINVMLSYLLLVDTIVLMSKFFSDKDISDNKYFWIFSFPLGYIFLLFFSKWVSKKYNNTLRQAEQLLKELES